MIPQRPVNGNGLGVADSVEEAANSSQQRPEAVRTIDLPTRRRQRARQQFQHNKLVIIGAGALVIAVLMFVTVSAPRRRVAQNVKGPLAGQQDHDQASPSAESSLLPITDSGRPPTKETRQGFVDEQDLRRTATARSNSSLPSTTQNGTLAAVTPFPQQWQAPLYKPEDGSTRSANDDKTVREGLEKSSVAYMRNVSNLQTGPPAMTESDPVLELGLPTGSCLRARLELAASTAVKTPVLAVIEYNYEHEGQIIVPAGAKAVGHIQQADRSGYMVITFDSLTMPDGATIPISGVATNLSLGPPKGKVEGKNTGKNALVRSLSGIGEVGALLVGRGNVDQPLSEQDMMRERLSNNIGQAGDEQVSRLASNEHIVVTIPANTPIYVVLEKTASSTVVSGKTTSNTSQSNSPTGTEQLRQLLQLQRELQQTAAVSEEK